MNKLFPALPFTALWVIAAAVFLPAPAQPSPEKAADYVQETGGEFLALASLAASNPEDATIKVQSFLEGRSALDVIARFTAGLAWREMNDNQRNRYRQAIRNVAARFLVRRLADAAEAEFKIIRSVEVSKRGYLVVTRIQSKDYTDLDVEWRVIEVKGEYKIADFVVEGVSLLVNYRTEVASTLEEMGGSIDALIEDLNAQAGN